MRKHYFLGTAAGYSKKQRILQRKASGTMADYNALGDFIKQEYHKKEVLITKNGRSAIAAALTYGLKEKGEVIVNGFTCYAVVQGIKAAGMTPVFADIDAHNLNFNLETIKKVVTKKTKAIIVQNTLGNMIDIGAIEKFAKQNQLILIEDLAHCTGRLYADGREAGTVGEVTVFSFGKDKSIDTVNGGAAAFKNAVEIKDWPSVEPSRKSVRRARWYPTFGYLYRGLSYFCLASLFMRLLLKMGLVKRSADDDVDFKKVKLTNFQAKLALLQLKDRQKNGQKPIRTFYLVEERELVLKKLKKAGFYFNNFWYEEPVAPARYYKRIKFPEEECPVAVGVAKTIINLPNYYRKQDLKPAEEIIKNYLWREK